jgi:hypothetical protein
VLFAGFEDPKRCRVGKGACRDGAFDTKWAKVTACYSSDLLARFARCQAPHKTAIGDVVDASPTRLLLLAITVVVRNRAALVVVLAGRRLTGPYIVAMTKKSRISVFAVIAMDVETAMLNYDERNR